MEAGRGPVQREDRVVCPRTGSSHPQRGEPGCRCSRRNSLPRSRLRLTAVRASAGTRPASSAGFAVPTIASESSAPAPETTS
jgi:hypothetical protein